MRPTGDIRRQLMKKVLLLAAVVCALIGAANAISATTTTVSITKAGCAPKNVTVTAGYTVKVVNNGPKYQHVECKTCTFPSPVLKPTESDVGTCNSTGKFA